MTPKFQGDKSCWRVIGSSRLSIWGPSGSETGVITTWWHCMFWHSFFVVEEWTWVIHMSNVLSIKTILFDILDFWCQLVIIRFVKTLLKRRMFDSFMKISACWLLHRLIKFNKICWEQRPAKPRPNLRTSLCRRELKNTQPHLKRCCRMRARFPPHVIMFVLSIYSLPLVLPHHLWLMIKFVISSRFDTFLIKFGILRGFFIISSNQINQSKKSFWFEYCFNLRVFIKE